MLPLFKRIHGRRLAAFALTIGVVGGGVYGIGSRLAQVSTPNICIRSFGPFLQVPEGGVIADGISAFPVGNHVAKVTGSSTVSVFSYDAAGVLQKVVDLPGTYKSPAITVVDDTHVAIAYYDTTAEGAKAFVRVVPFGTPGASAGTPFPIADIPAGFEPHVRFAVDTLAPGQFVVVTNIPDAEGERSLRAMVVSMNGTSGSLKPIGPSAAPPDETPEAIMDFDVAAIDTEDQQWPRFVIAFRGKTGAKFIRGEEFAAGVVFDDVYLKTISPTATNLDLASSYSRPKKAALSYRDSGRVYAGRIYLAQNNFEDRFESVSVGRAGDVLFDAAVAWINDEHYVAAYSVQGAAGAGRGGTYMRRGTAGSALFGSELRLTTATEPREIVLAGIKGPPGRVALSQRSAVAAETGLTASYCAGCIGGVADTGESCVTATTTGGGGGQAPICDPRFCGNGQEDPGEDCDDANNAFGDGCDALCRLECTGDGDCPSGECAGGICTSLCGNGVVEPPICVSEGGGFDCPPANPGEMRTVYLPGDVFATVHANGDLNNDGKQDIVVLYSMGDGTKVTQGYNGTLQAYINKGNGEFEPKKFIGNAQWNDGGGSRGLDVFDVDKDGDGDVVVYDGPNGIVLWRNNNLTFTKSTIVANFAAFHLTHGDVNGDADPELGLMGYQSDVSGYYQDSVLLGANGTSFALPKYIDGGTAYDNMRFADMNNDGDMDVVAVPGAAGGYAVRVHLSNGDGTFADPVVMFQRTANPFVHSIVTGDVNGDGNLDVAFTENSSDMVVVLGNGQGGSFSSTILTSAFKPRFVAFADPTADGKLDLVYGAGQGTEGKNLWLAAGKGDGTFETAVRFTTVSPPASGRPPFSWNYSYYYNYDLRAADYDGDGRLDLSMVHALSSDGASVILFRASVTSCTQVPPVVTCSQPEECDDGPLNGAPGKCTMRCTYCGNGQIDTVNGVTEACDEGAENGEPGSGCSLRCISEATVDPVHTACVDNQCVLKLGPGTNGCTTDAHCARTQHLTCVGVGACAIVDGPGMDLCTTATAATDCCDPADPTCGHEQCDFLGETCDVAPGPGAPQCTANNQCADFHFSCEGNQCAIQPGDGPDTCANSLDCTVIEPCNNDGQCSATESCQCLDCFDAVRCDACDGDTQCEAGESCGCAACKDEPLCQTHTECSGVQCVSVPGAGTNECSDPADCLRTQHLACTGVGACTIVQGPGQDTCSVANAAADCCDPADPTCDHRQCNFLFQSCGVVQGPAMDLCDGNADCAEWRQGCVGSQCALVPTSSGAPSCATDAQCTQACNNDNVCSEDESCLCLDCYGSNRCTGCDGDGVCEEGEGESCKCGDCADTSSCIPHLACDVVSRQCKPVLGQATNGCLAPEDCETEQHLACTGVGACTIVPGPGRDLCSTATAAEDCCDPADPTCNHRQCNPFTQSCITIDGPGGDDCTVTGDCEPYHSVCLDEACVAVPGEGPIGCLDDSMCIGNLCPNGTEDPGEDCDDGNAIDDDACNNECKKTCTDDSTCNCDETAGVCVELCGNGTKDFGEDCDEGPNNRATPPANLAEWYCRALSCTRSVCFDGGDNDSDGLPDAQDAGCWQYTVSRGNGGALSFIGSLLGQVTPLQPITPEVFLAGKDNEACPADTVDRGSFCALTCDAGDVCPGGELCPADGVCPVLCPNGAIDDDEQCDDGNLDNSDECNNVCRLKPCTGPNCPVCGDGTPHPDIGEQCDDGNTVNTDACTNNCRIRCDGDEDCVGTCDVATQQCLPPLCGDGETNQPWERCDDGDIDNEDACNNQCQPTCRGDADCESGRCDQARQVCFPTCGNGVHDAGEQCDDGNMIDGDLCNNQCQRHCTDDSTCDCDETKNVCRPLCGNGRVDAGESCDDGNADDRDSCNNRCQVRCRPGTTCADSQACPQNGICPVPGVCGDGAVNGPSEQCDDGNADDSDNCTNACRVRCSQNLECPSGLLCIGEECSECTNSLQCQNGFCVEGRCRQALPICGNGLLEPGEVCDDANGDDTDGCTSSCLFPRDHACVASAQCQTRLCRDSVCAPCASEGECSSGMRCAEGSCLFGSLLCGDGVVQAGEACDDANFNEQDQCTTACLLPLGQACTHATQCSSTICSGGACTPCRADAECSGGMRCAVGLCLTDAQMAMLPNICGNGLLEQGEQCDDGNGKYGDGCTPSCAVGNGPSRSEVAANVSVQLPFSGDNAGGGQWPGEVDGSIHGGAGDGLADTGPATVAVMAAGAAAGSAWVRRRFMRKKR